LTTYAQCNTFVTMKRTSIWLDEQNLKRLERIGKAKGGLKVSQVIRVAIQEYIDRQERRS
jgi:metal-responsive CopG/Arc/MetJ family transcriptional regulator